MRKFLSLSGRLTISPTIRRFQDAVGTAIYIALASWSYSAASAGDTIGAGVLLLIALLWGALALFLSDKFGAFADRSKWRFNMLSATALALVSVGLFAWEYWHKPIAAATPAEVKEIIQNKNKEGVFAHLRVRLVLEKLPDDLNAFHLLIGNIGDSTVKISRFRWSTGLAVGFELDPHLSRTLAPGNVISDPGSVISGLYQSKILSVEVDYDGDVYRTPGHFSAKYSFILPSLYSYDVSIDPVEIEESELNTDQPDKHILLRVDSKTGRMHVISGNRFPDKQ